VNDRRPPAPRSRTPRRVLLLLSLLVAGLPLPAAGQAATSLPELELEYRAALRAHEAAVAARQVVENQWRAALDSVTSARRSGDADRLDRASAGFLAQTTEFERLDSRVRDTRAALTLAREALLDALDRRAAELEEMADTARSPAQRGQILTLARDLQNQYRAVVTEGSEVLSPTPVFYPGILAYDPRDTPDLIQSKAELVERRIRAVEAQLEEARERIETIERLIRLRRGQENFNAPLDRFGDVQVPVVAGGGSQSRSEEAMPDSAGARPQTLEEQLAAWRLQEEQLALLVTQLEANLRRFRERIGARGTPRSAVTTRSSS
jgi:hypothetical protein